MRLTEQQFRRMGELYKAGRDVPHIARTLKVSKSVVRDFLDGQTVSQTGMAVFEEMTRPEGVTPAQHVAWLAQNGYRGFAAQARTR